MFYGPYYFPSKEAAITAFKNLTGIELTDNVDMAINEFSKMDNVEFTLSHDGRDIIVTWKFPDIRVSILKDEIEIRFKYLGDVMGFLSEYIEEGGELNSDSKLPREETIEELLDVEPDVLFEDERDRFYKGRSLLFSTWWMIRSVKKAMRDWHQGRKGFREVDI